MPEKISRTTIALSLLSGLLLTGAFPLINISLFAWFAMVPMLMALRGLSVKNSFLIGLLTGFVHYLSLLYWLAYTMHTYGRLPMLLSIPVLLLLAFYLALYIGAFCASVTGLCLKPASCYFLIPVFWVSFEYLRSVLFSGFPWELLGYSQHSNPTLIQVADLFGVYALSFLIALSNAVVFLFLLNVFRIKYRNRLVSTRLLAGSILFYSLLFCLVWFYGKGRIQSIDHLIATSPSMRVSVIQGNIDQSMKWDPRFRKTTTDQYIDLSFKAGRDRPDLIVWPETSTPFYFFQEENLTETVLEAIHKIDTTFLIGSPAVIFKGKFAGYNNRAYLIGPDKKLCGKYDKTHLVPFGEYVPLKKWFPFLGKMVQATGNFIPGNKIVPVKCNQHKLGLQICFEAIFSDISRVMVQNGADLLVNITNDAWFGRTSAPYQHFSMAVFRAIENRRSLVRSANTGISGFIDPVGRIIEATPLFEKAMRTRSIPIIPTKTVYTRYGDILPSISLVIMIFLFLQKFINRKKPGQHYNSIGIANEWKAIDV